MGAIAQIKDGKVVESNSAASLAKETKKNGSTMDKEAFLNLLVAQMKYQDRWNRLPIRNSWHSMRSSPLWNRCRI